MSTLRRDDGLQFIIQPYRELFSPESMSSLKRKVRVFAHRHGNNVRIFKHSSGNIEAVFSNDTGFLFGETVWVYLNRPNNLIYCEELPERRQAIVVVVRNGIVFMDAKTSFNELLEEFASLSTTEDKYDVFIYGDVPLSDSKDSGKFVFDAKLLSSFNVLEEPLLPKLPAYEATQLQPLELALISPHLGKSKLVPILVAVCGIIAIALAWKVLKKLTEAPPTALKETFSVKPIVDPYTGYTQALTSPLPSKQFSELISVLGLFNSLPGWKVSEISYNGIQYSVKILSDNGSITQLQSWVKANHIDMALKSDAIDLTIVSKLTKRSKPQVIYPLQDVLGLLIDEVDLLLGGKNVLIGEINNNILYKENIVNINFSGVIPGTLLLIGAELDKFPVAMTRYTVNLNNDLYSGSITLKVLGD